MIGLKVVFWTTIYLFLCSKKVAEWEVTPVTPSPLNRKKSAKYILEGLPIACSKNVFTFYTSPSFHTVYKVYAIAPTLNCEHGLYTKNNKFTGFGGTCYASKIPLKRIPYRSGKGLSTKSDHLDLFFPFKNQIR